MECKILFDYIKFVAIFCHKRTSINEYINAMGNRLLGARSHLLARCSPQWLTNWPGMNGKYWTSECKKFLLSFRIEQTKYKIVSAVDVHLTPPPLAGFIAISHRSRSPLRLISKKKHFFGPNIIMWIQVFSICWMMKHSQQHGTHERNLFQQASQMDISCF